MSPRLSLGESLRIFAAFRGRVSLTFGDFDGVQ